MCMLLIHLNIRDTFLFEGTHTGHFCVITEIKPYIHIYIFILERYFKEFCSFTMW